MLCPMFALWNPHTRLVSVQCLSKTIARQNFNLISNQRRNMLLSSSWSRFRIVVGPLVSKVGPNQIPTNFVPPQTASHWHSKSKTWVNGNSGATCLLCACWKENQLPLHFCAQNLWEIYVWLQHVALPIVFSVFGTWFVDMSFLNLPWPVCGILHLGSSKCNLRLQWNPSNSNLLETWHNWNQKLSLSPQHTKPALFEKLRDSYKSDGKNSN